VLLSRPKAVLGKKPPLSAPVGPPLPDSVKGMMAPPFPPSRHEKPSAAMAGNSRSSCLADTYPWLVARRPELAGGVSGVADLARRGLRLANREPGAEARSVLDRELAGLGIEAGQLPGYCTQSTGHLQGACAIAAGLADAGIASEPAALPVAWRSSRWPSSASTWSSQSARLVPARSRA
jgi:hypothetical protein